jgi:colanic acid/amylovoran biosynthesis glycosyltransferase
VLTIAYLANEFPAASEPYVKDEIDALRQLGVHVIAGSVKKARQEQNGQITPDIVLRPFEGTVLARAIWLCVRRFRRISNLLTRVVFRGSESPIRRVKAMLQTLLGACYAVRLQERGVDHIHVHHGFSGSWIAMVAARLLGIDFSMTLHGSDVLLHRAYLDVKLQNCMYCLTISEYNRRFLATHYPEVDTAEIIVAPLGVVIPQVAVSAISGCGNDGEPFRILTVGRLHPVKDHSFLVRACARIRDQGLDFRCEIAGEGPERHQLESLIRELGLEDRVMLLGHTSTEQTNSLYMSADLVVLTSRSEGIPLVLMEAMARGKLVLAPAITGIPELVIPGKTGFLYKPGSMGEFIEQLTEISGLVGKGFTYRHHGDRGESIHPAHNDAVSDRSVQSLQRIQHAARVHVSQNFNREKNLRLFTDLFLRRVSPPQSEDLPYASSVLQQI